MSVAGKRQVSDEKSRFWWAFQPVSESAWITATACGEQWAECLVCRGQASRAVVSRFMAVVCGIVVQMAAGALITQPVIVIVVVGVVIQNAVEIPVPEFCHAVRSGFANDRKAHAHDRDDQRQQIKPHSLLDRSDHSGHPEFRGIYTHQRTFGECDDVSIPSGKRCLS